jgi:hypothetical protein
MSTAQPGRPCELCGSPDHRPDAHFDGTLPVPPTRGGPDPADGAPPSYTTEPVEVDDDTTDDTTDDDER